MAELGQAKEFSDAVRAFETATKELSQNTGKEVGKIVGKDLLKVTDPFVNSFKQIPGVQTLGNVGKTLFNKGFAALKDKREKQLLADRLGLTKKEFKTMEMRNRANKAFETQIEKMGEAANNLLGFDESFVKDMVGQQLKDADGKFISLRDAIDNQAASLEKQMDANNFLQERSLNLAKRTQGNRAKQEEAEAEQAAKEQKSQTTLESIASGIVNLNKSFLAGLKDKGFKGLGVVAALVAAPFIALVEFFKTLKLEFAALKRLTRAGEIGKLFAPLTNLFKGLKESFKGTKFAALSMDKVKSVLTTLKNFFAPVGNFFRTMFDKVKTFTRLTTSANGIMKFAGTVGRVIGKIFLPVTILMGAFDLITGFIDGFTAKEGNTAEKVFAGLKEGLAKLFGNLIGAPLDLLKSGVAWVLKQFGFDETSEALKEFSFKDLIMDIVRAPFNLVEKIVDIITNFDFSSLIPDNKLTRFLGLVGDKTPEQQAKEKLEEEAKAKAEAEKKEREKRMRELSREVRRQEQRVTYLGRDAETQDRARTVAGFRVTSGESDEEHARDIAKLEAAQKELEAKKAELAALKAGGGASVVDASTNTSTSTSQSYSVGAVPMSTDNVQYSTFQ